MNYYRCAGPTGGIRVKGGNKEFENIDQAIRFIANVSIGLDIVVEQIKGWNPTITLTWPDFVPVPNSFVEATISFLENGCSVKIGYGDTLVGVEGLSIKKALELGSIANKLHLKDSTLTGYDVGKEIIERG